MDGDRHSRGGGTGGGSDSGHRLRPPAEAPPTKYLPPHLRNQHSSRSGAGPQALPLQRQGAGRSSEIGPTRSSWDPPAAAAAPPRRASLLPSKQQQPLSNPPQETENKILPVRRPEGRAVAGRSVNLLVNHFLVKFNPRVTIYHYSLDIRQLVSRGKKPVRKLRNKAGLRLILNKLFLKDRARFPANRTAYDGEKNLYSAVSLPTGHFEVELSGEDLSTQKYVVSIKIMNELKLSKLEDYLSGKVPYVPRDILQGMDMVMKENPSRYKISIDRHFYPSSFKDEDDLGHGIAAHRGFQSTLRPTAQGLALCLDCSVMAFRKPLPVVEFLKENVPEFDGAFLDLILRRRVANALKGLTVRVTHRRTKQLFTIAGLTAKTTRDLWFDFVDPKGKDPTVQVSLVQYFREKYGKEIVHQDIPCLILGRNNRTNHVPMEFCILTQGQRYKKELLDESGQDKSEEKCLARPPERKKTISEMMQDHDGPCGEIAKNFGIGLDMNMTKVPGRVLGAPELKVGGDRSVRVDAEKCQWNLLGKSFVEPKTVDRWALLDFTDGDRYGRLQTDAFVNNLRGRCRNLGINMAEPVVYRLTRMNEMASVNRLENLFKDVANESNRKTKGKLQLVVCAMTRKDPGYKNLKWVSETRMGVVTQCCLSPNANKGQDQYLANLCLKINAKLGGTNFEVSGKLLRFNPAEHVMFIGADVNHPAPMNKECPSIAAVVGTMNWPAANRYAARVSPQKHRCETIKTFGAMCLELVNAYARINKVRPRRIVLFRDGVSEGQFEMVLGEELLDLKKCIYTDDYRPTITVIVAQKRHHTRLFVENRNDGGQTGNVPPGTVVDTKIVHPQDFDFYLCSHYGGIGTSKPTHYYVLWDENGFTSDLLQKLIYDMCFTFVRCTKPVSLVPPVYYADLVAYRGRMFQEVAMEADSRRSTSSSTPSFDQSFYSLHPDLENMMFFV
ncbi:hypothetical protein C2S52_013838 [Perilla frutescens var. hirtella]|nr:hypothetical protein C2S52_013838 [Perilla frutescens var. hirtella]